MILAGKYFTQYELDRRAAANLRDYYASLTAAKIEERIEAVQGQLLYAKMQLSRCKRISADCQKHTGQIQPHEALIAAEQAVQDVEKILAGWEVRLACKLRG